MLTDDNLGNFHKVYNLEPTVDISTGLEFVDFNRAIHAFAMRGLR